MQYLEQICGEGIPPRRIAASRRVMHRGDGPVGRRRVGGLVAGVPFSYNGHRFCQGVRAFWALADVGAEDGGLVVVPASHNSTVPAPQDLVDGTDAMGTRRAADLAGGRPPALHRLADARRPGLGRARGRNACSNAGTSARACGQGAASEIHGEDTALPEWADDLTDIERAVLHNPNRPYPPPVVHSDGEKVWLAEEPGVFHPSIYIRDPDSAIDEQEFFHWDLCGHLVLRGVMDEEWLAAANEAIDNNPRPDSAHGGSAAGRFNAVGRHRSRPLVPWATRGHCPRLMASRSSA